MALIDKIQHVADGVMEILNKRSPIKQQMLKDGLHQEPSPDNARCMKCKYFEQSPSPFVEPNIVGPVIFVLGEPTEYDSGQLGAGYEWLMVRKVAEAVGLKREEYSYLTTTRCARVKGAVGKVATQMCSPFAFHALAEIPVEDRKLIAMGSAAMHGLISFTTAMDDAVGREFETVHGRVLVTYSVREYFHEPKHDQVLQVGILPAILAHVGAFVKNRPWVPFPQYKEVQ